MKKTLSETEGKHFEEGTGVMRILAESRRKYREGADQLLKELEEKKQAKQMKLIEMKESTRPDTTGFMKVNSPAKNEIPDPSNIWKWFKPIRQTLKVASAESSEKKPLEGIFRKGFEGKSLGHLFGQKGWSQTSKKQFEEIPTFLEWFPFAHKTEGQSPAVMSEWNNKELLLSTKKEAWLEPNSAWYRVVRPLVPTPEEARKSALSPFSSGDITRRDYGALFGCGNISSYFGQAEGEMTKSLSGLGNRYNEETRIEMDGLKEEIRNIKLNEDKMMRLFQDLKGQRKGLDYPQERDKLRSMATEEDHPEDEIWNTIRRGFEII